MDDSKSTRINDYTGILDDVRADKASTKSAEKSTVDKNTINQLFEALFPSIPLCD